MTAPAPRSRSLGRHGGATRPSPGLPGVVAMMEDPHLLGGGFAGPSWARWRAVLRAAFAEPMTAADHRLFREVAERDPPGQRVRELWIVAGRRAGKDSTASAIATVAALGEYRGHLRPGERATVMCLAVDRPQAKIVHRYIRASLTENPMLRPLIARDTDDGIEMTNGVEIIVGTNDFRTVRGRTFACVVFDEVAHWRSETSATPDFETYTATAPGLATLPGAMLIGISSPYRRAGLLYQKWAKHYGREDTDVLVVRGASRLFNPTLPQSIVDAALARDPEAARAEWLAEWRSDVSEFIGRDLIEAAVESGRAVRPPIDGVRYVAFADPSGGSGDSFTLGIAHRDGDVAVLDALQERRPPFNPENVVKEFAALLNEYRVGAATAMRRSGWYRRSIGTVSPIAIRSTIAARSISTCSRS